MSDTAMPIAFSSGTVALRARVFLRRLRLELEADERLSADHLGVVAGLDHVRLAGAELENRSVRVRDAHPARVDDADVPELAPLGADDRLYAVRPAPAGLEREPCGGRPAEVDDVRARLVGGAGLVGRVEVALLDTCHGNLRGGEAPILSCRSRRGQPGSRSASREDVMRRGSMRRGARHA